MENKGNTQAITNNYGFINPDDILKSLLSINGLLKKILGDVHDDVVYDKEAEFCRKMLKEVYQFKDTNDIFPKRLNKSQFDKTLETIFRLIRQESTGLIK